MYIHRRRRCGQSLRAADRRPRFWRGRIAAPANSSSERQTCACERPPKLQTSSNVSTPMASRPSTCAAAREIVERRRLGREPRRVVEGQDVDVVAEAHARGALERGGDHQVRARQERVVREVVLGEPALAEAERLGQRDLVQHLRVRLVVRAAAPLAVVEEPEVHRHAPRPVAVLPDPRSTDRSFLNEWHIQSIRIRTRGTLLRSGWTSSQWLSLSSASGAVSRTSAGSASPTKHGRIPSPAPARIASSCRANRLARTCGRRSPRCPIRKAIERKYSWGASYATHGHERQRASVRVVGSASTRVVAPKIAASIVPRLTRTRCPRAGSPCWIRRSASRRSRSGSFSASPSSTPTSPSPSPPPVH